MDHEKKIKMLQMIYAGALADSVLRLDREGILSKVTADKKQEQLAGGKLRADQLGIQRPIQVFSILPEIFGCANWSTEENNEGFVATATNCMLCGLSKKLGTGSPCNIHCLDAMEGLIKGLDESAEYNVIATLWSQNECKVVVKTIK